MTEWTADTMVYAMVLFICLAWLTVAMPMAVVNAWRLVDERRERRYAVARDDTFEDYGITYRVGSPPSHRPGRLAA